VEIFGDDVATVLSRSDYHLIADAFGGKGFLLDKPENIGRVIQKARQAAAEGYPVLINALIGRTNFRKGSISV
jgi:acetolactate synthase-1/2/3 large subunit